MCIWLIFFAFKSLLLELSTIYKRWQDLLLELKMLNAGKSWAISLFGRTFGKNRIWLNPCGRRWFLSHFPQSKLQLSVAGLGLFVTRGGWHTSHNSFRELVALILLSTHKKMLIRKTWEWVYYIFASGWQPPIAFTEAIDTKGLTNGSQTLWIPPPPKCPWAVLKHWHVLNDWDSSVHLTLLLMGFSRDISCCCKATSSWILTCNTPVFC